MKRIFASLILLSFCQFVLAQETFHDHRKTLENDKKDDTPESNGFNPERVFVEGAISLGYQTNQNGDGTTNNTFNIGLIPSVGYSLSNLFDVGISTSLNYASTTNSAYNVKLHQVNSSIGVFGRIYPLPNFFIQAMPEQDFISVKSTYSGGSQIYKRQSSAFLVGIGYGQREIGKMYFSTVIMLDLIKDINSPYYAATSYYVDSYGNQVPQSVAPVPILRGVIGFYPFRRKQK